MRSARSASRILPVVVVAAATLLVATSATAAPPAPHWLIISQPAPTYFHAGDKTDFYEVVALNDGGAPTTGTVTLKDTLPAGLVVTAAAASAGDESTNYGSAAEMACTITPGASYTVQCSTESPVPIGERVIAKIDVEVPAGASGTLANTATIAGGGAANEASTSNSTPVVEPSQAVPYGVSLVGEATEADGQLATQAGSHPFAFSTQLAVNVGTVNGEEGCSPPGAEFQLGCPQLVSAPKDVEVQLPPGLIGDPLAVPRCSHEQFLENGNAGCPASTQVGELYLLFYGSGTSQQYAPLYDVEPPPGQPAELGFTVGGAVHVPMFFHVRSDGDYGLTVDMKEISSFDAVRLATLMIWGVPASAAHDAMRESTVNGCEPGVKISLGCPSEAFPVKPFLRMPSSCSGEALGLPVASDSWQAPGATALGSPEASLSALSGCDALSFDPKVAVKTSTAEQGAPAGYTVDLKVPQKEGPNELATPDVRDVEVTLPEGTAISPSAANGLVACSDAQFGLKSGVEAQCPHASEIGTVRVSTPLLATPLTGEAFVGQPECGAGGICTQAQAEAGQMVRLLIEAQGSGVLVKLAGHTKIDRTTGRLTTVFAEDPQLPFEELEVALDGGPGAPLTNPTSCGPALAVATLTPWSASTASTAVADGPPSIEGCSTPAFTPALAAGMTGSARGGSFGSFAVSISRPDGQQDLGAVTLHLPPGLAAIIAKVPLCGEAQANEGACPAASQIGEATAVVGAGAQPYAIRGGRVYLTGPYGGGPYGLSIVVPAQAGPFHLAGENGSGGEGDGNVVVRGSIRIDPRTAALTIATNPIPTRLDGIPLHIRRVLVNVDRERFTFNPTNCDAMSVAATLTSSSGTTFDAKSPFRATDCAALPFRPGLKVFTHARHTKRFGAFLRVKVTSGRGQANIRSVFVKLPKALPSRTATLKGACSERQFAENPAGCPAASKVGSAIARTPVLATPLTGPAIFVSHGGAAFPDLDIVLQGGGITIVLEGATNIRHNVTSSDFKSVPDVPVSSFELTLPTGPHSALAANGNLCSKTVKRHGRRVRRRVRLAMPTVIVGQNGAVVRKDTHVAVSGCKAGGTRGRGGRRHRHR